MKPLTNFQASQGRNLQFKKLQFRKISLYINKPIKWLTVAIFRKWQDYSVALWLVVIIYWRQILGWTWLHVKSLSQLKISLCIATENKSY